MGLPVPNERARARTTAPRKLLITLAAAGVTFLITQLFNPGLADPGLIWSVAGSVFVGGATFIVQFLVDVERRLERTVNDRFMKVNQATELFGHVEASRLRTDDVVELVQHSAHIDDTTPDLLANFVQQEVIRLSHLLRRLGEGQDVLYEGEDRDWLLSLTRSAASTIEAVSLSTMDANGQKLIDNDIWKSDLGWRYLDIQKDAVRRKVRIRRIFIFDRPEVLEDLNFLEVYRKHQSFGIEVRVLGLANPMVRFTSVVDFVVFDGVVSYETTSATSVRDRPPLIVQTRLIREPGWVRDRIHRFEELWEQGEELGSAEIPA